MLRKKTITQVILDLLNSPEWCEVTPYEINQSDSEAFAWNVVEALGGEERPQLFVDATPEDEWDEDDIPEHFWVVYEGRYYDAECPGGVPARDQLPLFSKWARNRASR